MYTLLYGTRHRIKTMLPVSSHCRSVAAHPFGWQRYFRVATLAWLAALATGSVQAQDWVWENREMARTWALHKIAVIQAADGNVMGAKTTLTQLDDMGEKGTARVTAVWFMNGQAIYGCPPACVQRPDIQPCAAYLPANQSTPLADAGNGAMQQPPQGRSQGPGWGAFDLQGHQYFLARDRLPDRVPFKAPADLPSNYLAADPRHGPVVDFADDYDRYGTRVTSRRYADGHAVIETLAPSGPR
jgi:hypothetical protein